MTRVTHFDISAEDPQRAMSFYENVFGWQFNKWAGPMEYWLVTTGADDKPGINGGLALREEGAPATTVYTIDVDSLEDFLSKVEANGGKVVQPKGAIQGVGWFAMVQDSEGNMFGLMEEDTSAE